MMRNNKSCLPGLIQNGSKFKGDCNFEGASTVSNYGTVGEFAFPFPFPYPLPFPLPFSISISIVPGFTTSHFLA